MEYWSWLLDLPYRIMRQLNQRILQLLTRGRHITARILWMIGWRQLKLKGNPLMITSAEQVTREDRLQTYPGMLTDTDLDPVWRRIWRDFMYNLQQISDTAMGSMCLLFQDQHCNLVRPTEGHLFIPQGKNNMALEQIYFFFLRSLINVNQMHFIKSRHHRKKS